MPNPNLPPGGSDPQPTRKLKNWLDEVLLSQRLEDDQTTDLLDRTVSSEMQYMSLALKLQEKGICTVKKTRSQLTSNTQKDSNPSPTSCMVYSEEIHRVQCPLREASIARFNNYTQS